MSDVSDTALAAFKAKPSVTEHFGHVAEPLRELLVEHLISTCLGSSCGEKSESEMGAAKAISKIIRIVESAGKKPKLGERPMLTQSLNRNKHPKTKTNEN